jgi:PAS domain S-box-containing protein
MSFTDFSGMDASLRNYSEFVRNLPVAVYRTTLEGKIAFCNDPYARIFGFESVNDAIGFPEIKLYRNKKDRGTLIQSILRRGLIVEMPLAFAKRDRTPIWCSVTTKATFDDDGEVVFLDGLVRDITGEIEESGKDHGTVNHLGNIETAFVVLDPQGSIKDANEAAIDMIDHNATDLSGRLFTDFLSIDDQQLFFLFLGDVIRIGREDIILKTKSGLKDSRFVRIQAAVAKADGRARQINCVVRDVTEQLKTIKKKTNRDKFQGVLEMAGGVAHRFNQPLTIVNNMINETLSDMTPNERLYERIVKMRNQIQKLNDITRKVGNIKKYEAIDYVAGVKIVDIDRAS